MGAQSPGAATLLSGPQSRGIPLPPLRLGQQGLPGSPRATQPGSSCLSYSPRKSRSEAESSVAGRPFHGCCWGLRRPPSMRMRGSVLAPCLLFPEGVPGQSVLHSSTSGPADYVLAASSWKRLKIQASKAITDAVALAHIPSRSERTCRDAGQSSPKASGLNNPHLRFSAELPPAKPTGCP